MAAVWIGHIEVTPAIEAKIRRRSLTGAAVRSACEWPAKPIDVAWHDDPEHGRRLIVYAWTEDNQLIKAVLHPVDVADGTWRLKTAVISRRTGA